MRAAPIQRRNRLRYAELGVGAAVGPPVGASVGVVRGPAPEGVGVLTGLKAFCANTLFGRLTNKITGAAQAAWMNSRFKILRRTRFTCLGSRVPSVRFVTQGSINGSLLIRN